MSLINISNLTFAYDGSYDNVFENACVQLDTNWKLGLTGRNGRGKTTLLNLLLGKYQYLGSINADVTFEYFPYEVRDKNWLTIDILQEICPSAMEWEFFKELSLLDVREDVLYRPFSTLSNGEQTKTLLAALFLNPNSFLLIDEPTNHLDIKARKTVGEYLNRKKGFILVSHDRALLDSCVDHILAINKTNIEVQRGNFTSWSENKRLQDDFEIAENDRLKKEISRLSAAAVRNANWSDKVEKSKKGTTNSGSKIDRGYVGHKAAKMMKRSKVTEERQLDAIDSKSKLLHNIESSESLKLYPLDFHSDRITELKDVSIFYDENEIASNISFTVKRGERVALCGKNGCGKSSVLKLVCGEDIEHTGTLYKANGLKISYVSQDTSHLNGSVTDFARQEKIDESLFKAMLSKLDLGQVQLEKSIENLSEGQKKKILLAASLCTQAHLYVWDEPLNFIDVLSRIQIENLILKYEPTLLFVEHDIAFTENIATKLVAM